MNSPIDSSVTLLIQELGWPTFGELFHLETYKCS